MNGRSGFDWKFLAGIAVSVALALAAVSNQLVGMASAYPVAFWTWTVSMVVAGIVVSEIAHWARGRKAKGEPDGAAKAAEESRRFMKATLEGLDERERDAVLRMLDGEEPLTSEGCRDEALERLRTKGVAESEYSLYVGTRWRLDDGYRRMLTLDRSLLARKQ